MRRMNMAFVLKLLSERGITPAEFAREIGESQQAVHNWKARGRFPANKAQKIARCLKITADELMAAKLKPENPEPDELELSDEEQALIHAWRALPEEVKQQIHAAINQYQAALLNFPALANGTLVAAIRASKHFETVQAKIRPQSKPARTAVKRKGKKPA